MKIFVLSPSSDMLLTPVFKKKLERAGELVLVKKPQPFNSIKRLVSGREERILAIDPDFCDWKLPNTVIEKIPNLRAICLQTTSFSWVDTEFCRKKGIPVTNLRGFPTEAVAEWALMMALNLARRIPLIAKDGWTQDYVKHQGIELKGKTAGVVGIGRIGTRIAELCEGIGMEVQYWSRKSRDRRFKRASLRRLMVTSDVIFPAMLLAEETKKLITDEMLKSMKRSAIFVSIVHEMYNHKLLLKMVEEGKLFGYGFEEDGGGKFVKYKGNIWGGPALAWATDGSMQRNAEMWVDSIIKAARGDFENRVK